MSITPTHWIVHLAILLNRAALGLYFFLAGAEKFSHGLAAFYLDKFLALKPAWLPEAAAQPYGYALPFLEVIFGLLLVVGMFGRAVAVVLTLMLLSFTIALVTNLGDIAAGSPGPFHPNIIFVTLALMLAVTGPGRYSVDAGWLSRRRAAG